jgi:hypothetical protein
MTARYLDDLTGSAGSHCVLTDLCPRGSLQHDAAKLDLARASAKLRIAQMVAIWLYG